MHSVCVFDRIPDFDKLETYAPGINFLTETPNKYAKKLVQFLFLANDDADQTGFIL